MKTSSDVSGEWHFLSIGEGLNICQDMTILAIYADRSLVDGIGSSFGAFHVRDGNVFCFDGCGFDGSILAYCQVQMPELKPPTNEPLCMFFTQDYSLLAAGRFPFCPDLKEVCLAEDRYLVENAYPDNNGVFIVRVVSEREELQIINQRTESSLREREHRKALAAAKDCLEINDELISATLAKECVRLAPMRAMIHEQYMSGFDTLLSDLKQTTKSRRGLSRDLVEGVTLANALRKRVAWFEGKLDDLSMSSTKRFELNKWLEDTERECGPLVHVRTPADQAKMDVPAFTSYARRKGVPLLRSPVRFKYSQYYLLASDAERLVNSRAKK